MAWKTTLVTMVRTIIGDMGCKQVFDDYRVENAIVVGGLIASNDIVLPNAYTFDLELPDITPDPTLPTVVGDNTTIDTLAISLFTLKAACILLTNQYIKAVNSGLKVKEGDSEVDTTSGLKGYQQILINGPCSTYQQLIRTTNFKLGQRRGRAMLGPYSTGLNGCFNGYGGIWNTRSYFDNFIWF